MFSRIRRDIRVIFERDPAARSVLEVLFCYPGLHALAFYRLGHWLWQRNFKLTARILSNVARWLTGIEIHPGARIGEGFFIDHGMGVVIGETTEIGKDVTIYHQVTLGGTTWDRGKRHPTLMDNVVIGAGAKVLGPITLGENARVGSNSVVVKDVPAETTVVGVPGRLVMSKAKRPDREIDKDHPLFPAYGQMGDMPDPVVKAITCLLENVHNLDRKIEKLESEMSDSKEEAVAPPELEVVETVDKEKRAGTG